jgi:hypothetical protein
MRGENDMSDSSRHAEPMMPTEEVSIGKVFHLGGQWRAAIKIDDALVLVAKSRGEGFYITDDARLASSFRPDETLAEQIGDLRARRRPRRFTMGR